MIGRWLRTVMLGAAALALAACGQKPPEKLTVAAAANLTEVFGEVGKAFKAKSGIDVVFSFGATAQLGQQIENGAPFDVFAAADTEHVDDLVTKQKITANSRAVYAIGQLAMWSPSGEVHELKDLTDQKVRAIAVAQPDLAPYGKASVEALKAAMLWDAVQPKIVYGNTINVAKQMASSGNAEAAFTAYALVLHEKGGILKVDPKLYSPIEQALGIVSASQKMEEAQQFRTFLLSPEGQTILSTAGYLPPH